MHRLNKPKKLVVLKQALTLVWFQQKKIVFVKKIFKNIENKKTQEGKI